MTLLEKLHLKLRPHSDRIEDGSNDEFDYLPAVLHHVVEEQELQSRTAIEHVALVRDEVSTVEVSIREALQTGVDSINGDIRGAHDSVVRALGTGVDNIRMDVRTGFEAIGESLTGGVNDIRADVGAGFGSLSAELGTGVDSIKSDVEGSHASIRADIRTSVASIAETLAELSASMARERLKTQRFLLAGLIVGVLTLGGVVTIAILLYARR